mgnify:CR=1 FL=1
MCSSDLVNLESTSGKIRNDDLSDKEAYEFLTKAFGCFHESMAKDASIYVFYATAKARIFHDAYEDAGFKVGAGLVWKKNRLVLTRTDWKYIHEPIIWGWRKDGKHTWYGDQKQTTVFEFNRIKSAKEDGWSHPSSKLVPLMAYLIEQCTQTNGIVLDGFLGSASTLVAAAIYLIFHVSLEAWRGAIIAAVIIKIGLEFIFPHLSRHHHHHLEQNPDHDHCGKK